MQNKAYWYGNNIVIIWECEMTLRVGFKSPAVSRPTSAENVRLDRYLPKCLQIVCMLQVGNMIFRVQHEGNNTQSNELASEYFE